MNSKMMKIKSIVFFALIAILISCNACTKGEQGPTGADGNANVYGSNYVDVNWSLDNNFYFTKIMVPEITQDILDYGLVNVFILYGNEWWSLPDINGVNSTIYGFGEGYVSLINSNSDGSTPPYPAHSTFRVIVISSTYKAANPTVDWNNYKEVKIALNLAD